VRPRRVLAGNAACGNGRTQHDVSVDDCSYTLWNTFPGWGPPPAAYAQWPPALVHPASATT
jgi:hypothetical protein